MPVAYFDTSAIVKLVIDEKGTSTAQQAWNEADAVVSGLLSYPEARAALAAAKRQRRLAPKPYRAALDRFEHLWSSLEVVEIAPAIARFAGDLAERLALRGGRASGAGEEAGGPGGPGGLDRQDAPPVAAIAVADHDLAGRGGRIALAAEPGARLGGSGLGGHRPGEGERNQEGEDAQERGHGPSSVAPVRPPCF